MSDTQLTHRGVVQSIDGDQAIVAVAVQGCASCGQKKSCGVGQLAGSGKTSLLTLPSAPGLKPGDLVTLSIGQQAVNHAALLGYLLPAVLVVIGSVAGDAIGGSDLAAAAGALIGLTVGLTISRIIPALFRSAAAPLSLHTDTP